MAEKILFMDRREIGTVLAALKWYQSELGVEGDLTKSVKEIASDYDTLIPLTSKEIDDLCERINTNNPDNRVFDDIPEGN